MSRRKSPEPHDHESRHEDDLDEHLVDDEPYDDEPYDDEADDEPYDDEADDEPYDDEADDDEWDDDEWDDDGEIRPRILPRSKHSISRSLVENNALKVLYRLERANYKAYLVGGGVRDLMLGRTPKDFDISTSARPNEIRRLFRNARIIGRRFRLAHIIFHDGIVEVATFRRTPDPEDQKSRPGELLITNDNAFGNPRQDAFRRDFTINALFYNIADFSVIDYVGGIEDLEDRIIRVIGDPEVRFREDPVRMMRACEFAGRLDFDIEVDTQEGIYACREELRKAAPARLTEEVLQLLKSGHCSASFEWMLELGLLEVLLPELMAILDAREHGMDGFGSILPTVDALIQDGRELSDPVLLAAIMLPSILLRRFQKEKSSGRYLPADKFRRLVEKTIEPFLERFSVPNMKRAQLVQALDGFHRMCDGGWTPGRRAKVARKSYFPLAVQIFEILVRSTGEGLDELKAWEAADASQARRRPETTESGRGGDARGESGRRPRRRRRHRRS